MDKKSPASSNSRKFRKKLKQYKTTVLARPMTSALTFILLTWLGISFFVYQSEVGVQGGNIVSYTDSLWWGIVTLLTVGYGDRYPITPMGRFVASFLMVGGVVGIAIVTAKISSFFLERALRERRGFVDSSLLKNHFVICGWKEEMSNFLIHILESNRTIIGSDIVLLNNAPDSEVENILSVPQLKGVKVIKGDYFLEMTLLRAAPERASKVLILADSTPNAAGDIPTATEADARTIMTAMTLNNIAKGVSVAAEIIDSSMDSYLKLAHVSEIVYSRDYSRMLLAMASTGTGVTNVFHDLLSPKSPHFLSTKEIPQEFILAPYAELAKMYLDKKTNETLIGVLENSGNSHVAKEKAIRRAQQTPNIAELVQNLQEVKALKFNRPVFNPSNSYIIKEGCMAIVVENKGQIDV